MTGRSPVTERSRPRARRSLVHLASTLACLFSGVAAAQGVNHTAFPLTVPTGQSAPALVTVIPTASGTLGEVRVLTNGVAGKDFQLASGGTCTTLVTAGVPCTVAVTFAPTAPGRRSGAVVLVQSSPLALLGVQQIDGNASGALAVIQPGHADRVAGNGSQTQYVDGEDGAVGSAVIAHVFLPRGIVSTPAGDFYIADTFNNRIRRVSDSTSAAVITTIAGTGLPAAGPDGILAKNSGVNQPSQLALDGAGNLYIADTGNNSVRRIDAVTGIITTVAGGGNNPFSVDNVPATSATLAAPYGIALDAEGNLFIADTGDNVIRRVDATTGIITTVAGTGVTGSVGDGGPALAAQLFNPWGLAFGPDKLLYIADEANQAIRRLNADGTISTVAGALAGPPNYEGDVSSTNPGIATKAHLNFPTSIALDTAGNLYIADSQNNRIRRARAVNGSLDNAIMESVVSPGNSAVTTTNGTLLNADTVSLSTPYAISLDALNNLYISDAFNKRILLVHGDQALLRFPDMKVGKTSASQLLRVENDGTTQLTTNSFALNQSKLNSTTPNSCRVSGTVAVGASCALGVQFAPTSVSTTNPDGTLNTQTGTLTVNSNAANSPGVVTMQGIVLSVEPTSVTLTAVPAGSIGLGQSITFTALVAETSGNLVPSGTVQFFDGTTPIGAPVTVGVGGLATFSTSALSLGSHTVTAQYSGDDNNAASTSNALTVLVLRTTTVSLQTSAPGGAPVATPVTFTATVNANAAITSGNVEFYDGGTLLGTATVGSNSTASFTISTLTGGTHPITAKFTGDASSAASTSAVLQQVITKAAATASVSATPSTITVGNATILATTVTSSGPVPTGTVTFLSGNTTVGTGLLDANGNTSVSVTNLAPTSASITAIYGGDSYNSSATSPAIIVTVNRLLTTSTLSSSGTPANAGSPLLLTATVAMSPGQTAVGALTGSVTFFDGNAALNQVALTNGTATLSTTGLTVGSHLLTARYNGNTNYAVSTSTAFQQEIVITGSSTTLSVSSSNVIAGNPVTLTGSVTASGTVKPTGFVVFTDGSTNLGSVPLTASTGQASLTLSTLAPGAHNIVATYSGDPDYTASASAPATVTVRQGNVTLALTATPARTTYSTPVIATIQLSGDGVLPANPSVTLLDNGSPLATQTVNASGNATITTSTLAVGTHNLVAQYAGNANNAAAQSPTFLVTIDAAVTQTALSSNNLTPTFGDTVTLQAAVTSSVGSIGGNVTFQEGTSVLGVAAVNASGVATLSLSTLPVGSHTIVAVYGGDSTHATSISAGVTEKVTLPTQTSVTSSANPATAGLAVTFTANVTGSASSSGVTVRSTGTVTFLDGTTPLGTGVLDANGNASLTLSTLSVGTHSITAAYGGDGNFKASTSAAYSQTIRSAATRTALASSLNPAQYSAAITLTARVSGEGATPGGTVTFNDGANAVGQATLSNGVATLTIATLAPGVHTLSAAYGGEPGNLPSVSGVVLQSVIQPTQITLVSSSNPALTLETPVLTVTLRGVTAPTPTGTVRFLEGTRLLGTGTLDATGSASITAAAFTAGTHQLTAVYGGDAANAAVTSTPLTLTVNLRATQTSLSATASSQATNGTLSLVAVVKGGGTPGPSGVVTFILNGKTLGTSNIDTNGITTLNVSASAVSAGSISATYSGDASYAPSTSAQVTLPVSAATNFTLALNPSSLTIPSGKYSTTYLSVQSVNGFSDTLLLGCLGLPYAATCTFEKDTVALPANGLVKIKLIVDTGSPLTAGGELSSNTSALGKGALLATLPAGALLLLLLRKRRAVPALLFLLMLVMLLPAGGCGTLNQSKTPAGSYTIQVSVSGRNSAFTQSLPVSLTVTQ